MMLGVRYTPNGKFFRIAGQHMSNTNLVADGDLKTNNNNLLILPDLWQATLFIEKQASLRGQPDRTR